MIIDSGDGSGNTTAPTPEDPGWAYVGYIPGYTAVYLGDGWAITTAHTVPGYLVLPGKPQLALVPGSEVVLVHDPEKRRQADLQLFRVSGDAGLPPLPIRPRPPADGDLVIMIGRGRNRGERVESCRGAPGWRFRSDSSPIRWGTNRVVGSGGELVLASVYPTRLFQTIFDPGLPTPHEAQAAPADSGGAAFIERDGTWELAGILVASSRCESDPEVVVYGGITLIAELSFYRQQILDVMRGKQP